MKENVLSLAAVLEKVAAARKQGKTVVTTNGCFDILHTGHLTYLEEARKLGDMLIVGINSDASVRAVKGPSRPVNSELDRATLVAGLKPVDCTFIFNEKDPIAFLSAIKPDIHAKGGDYQGRIIEQDTVEKNGGQVRLLGLVPDRSTTRVIERMQKN